MKQGNHDMTLEQYKAALAAHDWYYEYSDDHRVWCEGRDHKAKISEARKQLDPDYAIWNEYAPEGMKAKVKA
jgi:hypothetical protein